MGKDKNRKNGPRHSSVTPQKSSDQRQSIFDLTQTDPWAHQARKAKRSQSVAPASGSKPTPLSPAFSGKKTSAPGSASRATTTIEVPQDPIKNKGYVLQQLSLAKNRANVRPSFFGAVRLNDEDGSPRSDQTARDDTPTPGQNKEKKKKKSKGDTNGKGTSAQGGKSQYEVEEAKRQEKKKRHKGEMEQQTARAVEIQAGKQSDRTISLFFPMEVTTQLTIPLVAAANESRKRKREDEEADEFKRRVETEAYAFKKLRESIPPIRIQCVARMLEREQGVQPTEMAVLLTTARETVLDLARQQIMQTEMVQETLQKEMVGILKKQKERLAMLEGKHETAVPAPPAAPAAVQIIDDDTSSAGSDASGDVEDDEEDNELIAGPIHETSDKCPTQ